MKQIRPDRDRRRLLAGLAAVGGLAAVPVRLGPGAFAQQATAPLGDFQAFMEASRRLFATDLERDLGRRLFDAVKAAGVAAGGSGSDRDRNISKEGTGGDSASDSDKAVAGAWLTGTVGGKEAKRLVTYERALMYRAVENALPVPTYCIGPSGYWVDPPGDEGPQIPAQKAKESRRG